MTSPSSRSAPTEPRSRSIGLRHVLVASLVGAGVAHLVRHFSGWHSARRHKDTLRDEALDETFPASDPPASQNFDTPRNRL